MFFPTLRKNFASQNELTKVSAVLTAKKERLCIRFQGCKDIDSSEDEN
jgi:hypothetical protein